MIDRQKYLDDYGTQIDPLFDRIDDLENALELIAKIAWGPDGDCGAAAIIDSVIS